MVPVVPPADYTQQFHVDHSENPGDCTGGCETDTGHFSAKTQTLSGSDLNATQHSPDESGSKRREKGLSKSGNARVRRGMIQLAWRFLHFQKDSALAQWFRSRVEGAKGANKRTMIVALARKLLIALWRMVNTGEVPQGIVLRQPA
jgi:hypothetical protein